MHDNYSCHSFKKKIECLKINSSVQIEKKGLELSWCMIMHSSHDLSLCKLRNMCLWCSYYGNCRNTYRLVSFKNVTFLRVVFTQYNGRSCFWAWRSEISNSLDFHKQVHTRWCSQFVKRNLVEKLDWPEMSPCEVENPLREAETTTSNSEEAQTNA